VLPVLDAKQIKHRTHLSLDTIEAPASAVGEIIRDTADSVGAQLVIVGHNRQPVSTRMSQDDVPALIGCNGLGIKVTRRKPGVALPCPSRSMSCRDGLEPMFPRQR